MENQNQKSKKINPKSITVININGLGLSISRKKWDSPINQQGVGQHWKDTNNEVGLFCV